MGLSSNTIIHFTKTRTSLEKILSDNFKVHYCREVVYSRTGNFDFLIPMVSFCDIPFSQIITHIKNYGAYGIGLKKSWAEEKGLNPVLYVEKNSNFGHGFFVHLWKKVVDGKTPISDWTNDKKYLFDVVRYMKNYQGVLKRNSQTINDYRFSDEREWRYVLPPNIPHLFVANCIKVKDNENITSKKKALNEEIQDQRLHFNPDNISYIVIKKESERDDIIRLLERVKAKYSYDQIKRLTSRIISTEQIKTDF